MIMVESTNHDSVLHSRSNADEIPTVPSPGSSPPNGTEEFFHPSRTITNGKENLDHDGAADTENKVANPSPSRTAVEALFKTLPRFYKGHKEQITSWDHPLLTKIFEEDIASYNDVRYAAYRTALKFRTIANRLQLHQIKLSTIRTVLKQHGYEAIYQNQTVLPCVELETLMADIYLSARREVPSIDKPEQNAELLLCLLLKLYDTNRCGCIKLISAKIGLALLAAGSYLEKWKYILSELFDYNRCLSRKNAFMLLHDVARIPEVLGEKRLFGTQLVPAAVESLWIRGRPTPVGLPEEGFRHWLKDEPQTLVWLSTSYRIRQAERLHHHIKCSICRTQPFTGLRYRCLRCYNYNMCQNCFFTGKFNKSHRLRHPIREYCSYVTAGQETKDLIKIMKNRVFRGEEYESKPRYMPILPDSVSALELGADSDPETDNRSRSTAPSHGNSIGTPSGSVNTVSKKDFEVDVEVISELDSAHGGKIENSFSYIPRSISEPVDGNMRFGLHSPSLHPQNPLVEEAEISRPVDIIIKPTQHQENIPEINRPVDVIIKPPLNKDVIPEIMQPVEVIIKPTGNLVQEAQPTLADAPLTSLHAKSHLRQKMSSSAMHASPTQTKRQISAVTAQILNYAEVDVLLPKQNFPSPNDLHGRTKTEQQLIISVKPPAKGGSQVGNQAEREFSVLDYIDESPRGELPMQYGRAQSQHQRPQIPRTVNKSSVEIQTDVAEHNGEAMDLEEMRREIFVMKQESKEIHDKFDAMHRLTESSSPSPELFTERRQIEKGIQSRNAAFESELVQLEKMLVDNLGRKPTTMNGHAYPTNSTPVWQVNGFPPISGHPVPPSLRYVGRSESLNESLTHHAESRLPPFPVNKVPKAISDPSTPLRKGPAPFVPHRHPSISDNNGVSYHPILDELEEKLRSLNAPLTTRDLKHPFWHHLKEKFEYVLGQSNKGATASATYQSYGKIDKDYAHTPANYGRNIAHNSHLDVSDNLLPGIAHPSPNESQSSGFSSGRETDLKWEEEISHAHALYQPHPGPSQSLSVSTGYRIPRSKSLGISTHRQVTEDIAQLDKLLEWLDEFKKA